MAKQAIVVGDISKRRVVSEFPEMNGEAQEMVTDVEIEKEIEAAHPVLEPGDPGPEVSKTEKPKGLTLEDLSVGDLRYLLEQKLLKEAEAAAVEMKKVEPPSKAPRGMKWVFNRSPQKYEWQYDGVVYEIEGHEMLLFQENIARHARKRSIVSLDAFSNHAVFKIALEGEEKFGMPLKTVNRTELVDRSTNDNPLGRGPGRTHPALLQVDGVADMLSRRQDKFAELE